MKGVYNMTNIEKMNAAKLEKLTAKRNANCARIRSNAKDSGAEGKVFEIECARPMSAKVNVSAQNRSDVHILLDGNYVAAECKTNGGRVDDLLNGTNKAKFVIYRLCFVQKHKASKKHPAFEEVRSIDPVIIPTALFLNMLQECNALKAVAHDGVIDGIAIQPSSKKMYERLAAYIENYQLTFSNTAEYESWMFEGVAL